MQDLSQQNSVCIFFSCLQTMCDCSSSSCSHIPRHTYSREFLLDTHRTLFSEHKSSGRKNYMTVVCSGGQLLTPTHAPSPKWKCHKWKMRKQKRGKRGGIRARLAASPHWPAITTITLANIRLLENKLDHIHLLRTSSVNTVHQCWS